MAWIGFDREGNPGIHEPTPQADQGGPHNTREAPGPFLQDEQTAPALLELQVSAWRERTLGEHTPEPSSTSTIHPSPSQAMTLKVVLKHTDPKHLPDGSGIAIQVPLIL